MPADFKHILHTAIALFAFTGVWAPKVHVPVCAAILAHWATNNNRCFLSDKYEDENGFTKELLGYVGVPWPTNKFLQDLIPYMMLLIPMSVSSAVLYFDKPTVL